jgi:LacI family transcriptional regulator
LSSEQKERSRDTAARPTLRTLAAETGFAVATVSRALANDPKIAESTRETVAAAARRLGYVPDRAAQRLRTGRTKVISLILDPHHEILGFTNELIEGITGYLTGTGFHLTVFPQTSVEDALTQIQHVVRNNLADGVIFSRTRKDDSRARFLLDRGFPFACHGRTELPMPHPFVDFDNEAFAYAAATRLAEGGARRLCLISPPQVFTFSGHLRAGVRRVAEERGLSFEVPEHLSIDSPPEQVSAWAEALDPVPDGFVFPGEVSFLATSAGLRRRGLARGRDYNAVVKVSSSLLSLIDPETDRIFEDIRKAGRLLGETVLAAIDAGKGEMPKGIIYAPEILF